jgi:putative membrane protein
MSGHVPRRLALAPVNRPPRERTPLVPLACLGTWFAAWLVLAIDPTSRADWWLENVPVLIGVPLAVATFDRFRFSDRAYVQATLMLLLHAVGAHYTYSLVPLGDWVRDALGLARNHYDRAVHLAFGALMLRPMRELAFRRMPHAGGFAVAYLSVAAVGLWSVAYELVEWTVASIADPAAGTAYLGTQGDEWDAQKDLALAVGGAVGAAAVEWWLESGGGPGGVSLARRP